MINANILYPVMGLLLLQLAAGCRDDRRSGIPQHELRQEQDGPQVTDSYFLVPMQEYYDGEVKPVVEQSRAQLAEVHEASVASAAAIKEVKENVASARQSYADAKKDVAESVRSVRQTVGTVKNTVGAGVSYITSRVPTSEKEANEMVESREKVFVAWLREKLKAFQSFFRRNVDRKRLQPRGAPLLGGNNSNKPGNSKK